jgi:hypothetical protein
VTSLPRRPLSRKPPRKTVPLRNPHPKTISLPRRLLLLRRQPRKQSPLTILALKKRSLRGKHPRHPTRRLLRTLIAIAMRVRRSPGGALGSQRRTQGNSL